MQGNALQVISPPSLDAEPFASLAEGVSFTAVASRTGDVYAGQSDGTLSLYSIDTGEQRLSLSVHDAPINTIGFSADNRLVATGSGDLSTDATTWTLRLWEREALLNGETPMPTRSIRYPYPVTDVAFSGDGQYMAVIAEQTGPEAAAALWVYGEGGLGENLLTLALSDTDGSAFVTVFPDDRGDFVFPNGSALSSLTVADGNVEPLLILDGQILTQAAFNPAASETLAVATRGEGGGVTVYNASGLPSAPVATLPGPAADVSFSVNGDALIVQGEDGSLIFYQIPG
jgi:WD40 repeat protein